MNHAVLPFSDAVSLLPERGEGRIILCDCNGTLFDPAGQSGLNRHLFAFLCAAEERGYEVHLHSGDATGNMQTYVPIFSLMHKDFRAFIAARADTDAGPILAKGDIHSAEAFLTIDDQHGGEFLSRAAHQWGPRDPAMYAVLRAWGVEIAPPAPAAAPGSRL